MYRCNNCGAEFENPRMMVESHGEKLGHCPNCLDTDYTDIEELHCDACEDGYVEYKGERWCTDCKRATIQAMNQAVLGAVHITGATISTAVNTMQDVMMGHEIETKQDRQIASRMMAGVVDIAYERGVPIDYAYQLAEAWAIGTL